MSLYGISVLEAIVATGVIFAGGTACCILVDHLVYGKRSEQ